MRDLERYKRHLVIPEIGSQGQEKLRQSHITIIGAGALGGPVAQYLGAAGIGALTLYDDDLVDLSNLQRQIQFDFKDIGRPKSDVLKKTLQAQNPEIDVISHVARFSRQTSLAGDLVIDCCDNFETRFAINQSARAAKIPMLSGAVGRWEAQLGAFNTGPLAPCYQCWIPEIPYQAENCVDSGVVGPLCGIVGALLGLEAIKLRIGRSSSLEGKILTLSALSLVFRSITLNRDPSCPECSA